jgi:hypothetical protein
LAIIITPEVADETANSVVPVAELSRNGRHRLTIDKEGTHRFVLALARVGRLEEEGAVTIIVHDAPRNCGAIIGLVQLRGYLIEATVPERGAAGSCRKMLILRQFQRLAPLAKG